MNRLLFIITLFVATQIFSSDYKLLIDLKGNWDFSVGDDSKWSSPTYNSAKWDKIYAPASWEEQGYQNYNGFAWYRKTFKFKDIDKTQAYYLILGRIDDVDEVYINGHNIGGLGKFPIDEYKAAFNIERKYLINPEYLKQGENIISIRVYDDSGSGGILEDGLGIYIDVDDYFLKLNLAGKWKFNKNYNSDLYKLNVDDINWGTINAPQFWDSQEVQDYQGFAWYRKTFDLPDNFNYNEIHYFALGKIDEEDIVYLNGVKIGDIRDVETGRYHNPNIRWWLYRVYTIPISLLKSKENVIAVRVYNKIGQGGIYEGPIGIMNSNNYNDFLLKHKDHYNNFIKKNSVKRIIFEVFNEVFN